MIKWTDPSVTKALQDMAQVVGDSSNIYGGTSGALQTDYPTCVDYAFATPPKAAWCPRATSSPRDPAGDEGEAEDRLQRRPVPGDQLGANANAIETSGDEIITFRDTPAIEAFMKYLATSQAAEIWAKLGGFGTRQQARARPASIRTRSRGRRRRRSRARSRSCSTCRTSSPPRSARRRARASGGSSRSSSRTRRDISSIQQQLESSAAKAYKSGK